MIQFTAHRVSSDANVLYPDTIRIDEKNVYYSKGHVVGYTTTIIPLEEIAGVTLRAGLFFATVVIYSTGNKVIEAEGFTKRDANRILSILR